MDQYKQYLAVNVLNERQFVNYRLLSRALRVHVNLAKQMLWDFHHTENAKKPQSVHSTYLITGTKRPQPPHQTNGSHTKDDGDHIMQSSPFPSSMPEAAASDDDTENVLTTTIALVREEDLEEAKSRYEEIKSIFVYSLQPGKITDLQVLSDCNRRVRIEFLSEDPLEMWKQYGVIQNPNVRRRSRTRPPPAGVTQSSTSGKSAAAQSNTASKTEPLPPRGVSQTKKKETTAASNPASSSRASSSKLETKTIRRQSSDLFKSFAKSKAPKPKSNGSAAATPTSLSRETSKAEDEEMNDVHFSEDDDAGEDEDMILADSAEAVAARKEREVRQAKLKQMMEEDHDEDEVMAEVPAPDAAAEDGSPIDSPPKESEQREEVHVEGGRRRGRRRVMKKKTVQDEDGYLVTTEEPAWESFSEDEPDAKKPRMQISSAFGSGKGKKGPRGAQGGIMKFFKKG